MRGILAKSSENKLHGLICPKNPDSVETAGSLAMNAFHSLFESNNHDEFYTNNPFAVDYSLYAESFVADNGFLSSFSNAISVIDGGVCTPSNDCGGSAGGASEGSSFASFC